MPGIREEIEALEGVTRKQQVPKGSSIIFAPTLYIGVGGTGIQVLRRLKRKLLDTGWADVDGKTTVGHEFVYIDADNASFSEEDDALNIAEVMERETILIGKEEISSVIKNRRNLDYLNYRFPIGELSDKHLSNLRDGTGAGQIRGVGAFAYTISYMNSVKSKLSDAITELKNPARIAKAIDLLKSATRGTFIRVYVVGSLAGGTGSGCFLDVAMEIKSSLGEDCRLIGVFTLPEGYHRIMKDSPVNQKRIYANTYAALKELSYAQGKIGNFKRNEFLDYDYGSTGGKISLPPSDKLFHVVNLFDVNRKEGYESLPNLESLYSMISSTIYQSVATPFGAKEDTEAVNANPMISASATAELVFPVDRIIRYCRLRSMADYIEKRLIVSVENQGQAEDVADSVDNFLAKNNLEERFGRDQISNYLLRNSGYKSCNISPAYGAKNSSSIFAKNINEKIAKIDSVKTQISERITVNLELLLDDKKGIQGFLRDYLKEREIYGVNWIIRFLKELLSDTNEIVKEVKEDIDKYANQQIIDSLKKTIVEELSNVGDSGFFSSTKRKNEINNSKTSVILKYNNLLNNTILCETSRKVLLVLDEASHIVLHLLDNWKALEEKLGRVKKATKSSASALLKETSKKSDYAFGNTNEVDMTFKSQDNDDKVGFDSSFYEKRKVSLSSIHERAKLHLPGNMGLLSWMMQKDLGDIYESIASVIEDMYGFVTKESISSLLAKQIEEYPEQIRQKLESVFSNSLSPCLEFSSFDPNFVFSETVGIFSKHVSDGGQIVPEDFVRTTLQKEIILGANIKDAKGIFHINIDEPTKIIVTRRIHDIPFNGLDNLDRYEEQYLALKPIFKDDKQMFHTHSIYCKLPEFQVIPEKDELSFALALALGFIAKRLDKYIFVLENVIGKKYDYSVSLSSDWHTINLVLDPASPQTIGGIQYLDNHNANSGILLGRTRFDAKERFFENNEYVYLVDKAVVLFARLITNSKMAELLKNYLSHLSKLIEDSPASSELYKLYSIEHSVLRNFVDTLESN